MDPKKICLFPQSVIYFCAINCIINDAKNCVIFIFSFTVTFLQKNLCFEKNV